MSKPKDRLLFLRTVNSENVATIIKSIHEINESDAEHAQVMLASNSVYTPQPIKLMIDSPGGSVYSALGLIGIMKASKVPVHTYVTGAAMSAGMLISIAGARRFAYEYTTFMIHQISSFLGGTLSDIQTDYDEMVRLQKVTEKVISKNTKISEKAISKIMNSGTDLFIDVYQAKQYGIIDEIIT